MQIWHRAPWALPEPDKFCSLSKRGNKVERSSGAKLHRALAYDIARVGYIEYSELGTPRMAQLDQRGPP
jgi:hypothetical protein